MAEQRYVVLEGSKVVNIIMWDPEDANTQVSDVFGDMNIQPAIGDESVGWELIDGEWVSPLPPEPPAPVADTTVLDAKYSALKELTDLGVSETNARIIVGLPPAEEEPA